MSQTRRHFDATLKAQIVRRHLSGKEPVSALADEFQLQPTQIHTWVNQVLAQAEKAFERSASNGRAENAKDRQIEALRSKLSQKNEVIAELMEDNLRTKKELGEI
jgi:transposase-like protein